jgi:hypothetical protein
MTSLPEQTPKKTPIVESCRLPSNGCKQTLALLPVDPQRARHNILVSWVMARYSVVGGSPERMVYICQTIRHVYPRRLEYELSGTILD